MDHQDLNRMNQLLNRSSEFIAYFEVADQKMIEWRHEVEQNFTQLHELTKQLEHQFLTIDQLLDKSGIETLKQSTQALLNQGEAHLKQIEETQVKFLARLQEEDALIQQSTQKSLQAMEEYAEKALHKMTAQLSKYDAQHFHRIANESCDHVERVAHNALSKSNQLFKVFQLRLGILTAVTSFLTAVIMVLYLSDENPWEVHRQAHNERQAGKLLLQAWPNLTQIEKSKILNHRANSNG